MKRAIITVIIVLLYIPAYSTEIPQVALLNLEPEGISSSEANSITGFLMTELANLDALTILERKNMEQILSEQKLQISGCTSSECAVKIGKLLNVNKIIVGTAGKFAGEYYIEIRYVDVETSMVDFSERTSFNRLPKAYQSCSVLVDRIVSRITSKAFSYKKKEKVKDKISVEKDKRKNIKKSQIKLPTIIPGFGQINNGKYLKGGLVLSLWGCSGYYCVRELIAGLNSWEEYKLATIPADATMYYNQSVSHWDISLLSGVICIGTWIYSILDAKEKEIINKRHRRHNSEYRAKKRFIIADYRNDYLGIKFYEYF